MKIDLTTIIALIIALFAFISPVITAIIDNRYKIKMRQIEQFNIIRENAVNDFIDVTFKCKALSFNIERFYVCLNKVLIYIDERSSEKLGKLKYLVENDSSIKEINSALMEFILYLNGSQQSKARK